MLYLKGQLTENYSTTLKKKFPQKVKAEFKPAPTHERSMELTAFIIAAH